MLISMVPLLKALISRRNKSSWPVSPPEEKRFIPLKVPLSAIKAQAFSKPGVFDISPEGFLLIFPQNN